MPLSALKWQQQHLASSCPDVTLLDHSSDPELQVSLGMARAQLGLLHTLVKENEGACMLSVTHSLKASSSCQVNPERGQ